MLDIPAAFVGLFTVVLVVRTMEHLIVRSIEPATVRRWECRANASLMNHGWKAVKSIRVDLIGDAANNFPADRLSDIHQVCIPQIFA